MYVYKIDNDFKAVKVFTMYLYSTMLNCNLSSSPSGPAVKAIDPVFGYV